MPDGLFIFFAALTLGAASLLVLSRNAVTSAMGMILALVGVAADFFLLSNVPPRPLFKTCWKSFLFSSLP